MSEETKFPEWRRFECGDHVSWTWTISKLEMDDWFRRCFEEFPEYQRPTDYTNKTKFPHWDLDQMNSALKVDRDKWFIKWFSQFIEEIEE